MTIRIRHDHMKLVSPQMCRADQLQMNCEEVQLIECRDAIDSVTKTAIQSKLMLLYMSAVM